MGIRSWGRRLYELWDPWASKQHLHSRLVASLDTIDAMRAVLKEAGVAVDGKSIVEAARSLAADRDEVRKQADDFARDNAAKAEEIVRLHSEAADVRRLYGELERSHAQLREAHEGLRRRSEAGATDAQKLRRRWAEVCDIVNRPMDSDT